MKGRKKLREKRKEILMQKKLIRRKIRWKRKDNCANLTILLHSVESNNTSFYYCGLECESLETLLVLHQIITTVLNYLSN